MIHFYEWRDLSHADSTRCPECHRKIAEASPAGYTHGEADKSSSKTRRRKNICDFGPVLVWSQQNYLKLPKTVRYLSPPRISDPAILP